MAKLAVEDKFNPEMEAWDSSTNDYYGNWNEAHKQLLSNEVNLKNDDKRRGLSVVDGRLCATFLKKEE